MLSFYYIIDCTRNVEGSDLVCSLFNTKNEQVLIYNASYYGIRKLGDFWCLTMTWAYFLEESGPMQEVFYRLALKTES